MKWTTFIVYGEFVEPTKQENFIIVRRPEGRVPWSKKITPAIHRLVKPWFDGKPSYYPGWGVDGDHALPGEKPLWEMQCAAKYEWTPEKGLQKAEQNSAAT